jgi:hypothetical protein
MSIHTKPKGVEIISGISTMASALGYHAQEEYEIPGSGAAIDVAWFAAADKRYPIFVFEVESSASSSMANNAMKVYARDVDQFIKPLFFFHVLLSGGPDNDRIRMLRKQWGNHNYRVYRLNDVDDLCRLILDILGQHRRINPNLDIDSLFSSLQHPAWSCVDTSPVLEVSEELEFDANFRGEIASLARQRHELRPEFIKRLKAEAIDGRPFEGSYDSYIGRAYGGLLELTLLVGIGEVEDSRGAGLLEAWQNRADMPMRWIGPYFGLDHHYDEFIIGIAPFLYGVSSLLCRRHPISRFWLLRDLSSILFSERWERLAPPFVWPGALWLAHMAASYLADTEPDDTHAEAARIYHFACDSFPVLDEVGVALLEAPPWFIEPNDLSALEQEKNGVALRSTPSWQELRESFGAEKTPLSTREFMAFAPTGDRITLALAVLCADAWTKWSSAFIVRALHH